MLLTDTFVLPGDVAIVPVADLADDVRAGFAHDPGDCAVTRRNSRTSSRIVDGDLAALLELFRDGSTIAGAVAVYAQRARLAPERVLEDALPSLRRFIGVRWLVPAGSPEADPVAQRHPIGGEIAGHRVVDCIRVLEDTQIYEAIDSAGRRVALKVLDRPPDAASPPQLRSEICALRAVGGAPAPALYAHGAVGEDSFLALEWCDGVPASVRAAELGRSHAIGDAERLQTLCVRIVDAYARLHARGVIHGDVHPGNVLVDDALRVRLVDFGLAVSPGHPEPAGRGGVPAFFDPQHAADRLAGLRGRRVDHLAEQYSVAALLYVLLTGREHLEGSSEQDVVLRQVVEAPPRAFADVGTVHALAVETALHRALSKEPGDRHASMAAFRDALAAAATPRLQAGARRARSSSLLGEYVDAHLARIERRSDRATDGSQGPHATVNFGSAGIAYALYRIALSRQDAETLAQADHWATRAVADVATDDAIYDRALDITEASVGRSSPYHTESGIHAVQVIVAQAMGDFVGVREGVERYLVAIDRPTPAIDLTLGRSGLVLANVLLLDALEGLPTAVADDLRLRLRAGGDHLVAELWNELEAFAAIGPGNALAYLGIAHGWAGVCFASLMWSQATGAPVPADVERRLDELAACATPSGTGLRWPIQTHARGHQHNIMNSWCNGAPGYVFLWNAAHALLGDQRYAELADLAARETSEGRDAIVNLCCGSAGRAYALLNQYRHTGDLRWLERAHDLTEHATRTAPAELRDSLYKGELGAVVLAAELADPISARLPFFEREI